MPPLLLPGSLAFDEQFDDEKREENFKLMYNNDSHLHDYLRLI